MATSKKAKTPLAKSSSAKQAYSQEGFDSEEPEQAARKVQKRRALLIGVNHYDELTTLKYAAEDVKAIKDRLEGFRYEDIQLLHDGAGPKQKPTYKNVLRELQAFVKRAESDDLLLVYFAGHGKMKDDKAWLLLSDSKWNLKKEWYDQVLSVEKVKSLLKQGASERLVLMMDACQTGGEGERDVVDPSERARFIRRAYEEAEGIVVFAGSSPGQKAQELDELGHGVFTNYILEGLADERLVDERTPILTVSRLAAYVTQKVSKWGKRKSIYVQMPRLQVEGMDLALVDHTLPGTYKPDNRPFPQLRQLRQLEGHEKGKEIRQIAVPPKGARFLTASADGTARLWNVRTGKAEDKPYRHPEPVLRATCFRDGKTFVTLSKDGALRYWQRGAPKSMILAKQRSATALTFTPAGDYLAVGTRSGVWFTANGSDEGVTVDGHQGPVRAIAFCGRPETKLMATGADDGTVILRDYPSKKLSQILYFPINGPKGAILNVALSPDGRLLAMGGQDPKPGSGPLRQVPIVWSLNTKELLYYIREHTQTVTALQFSPSGHFLLTASRDGTARIWRASNGELLQTLDEPRIAITAAAFSADGTRVILGYADGSLRIFGPKAPSSLSKGSKEP